MTVNVVLIVDNKSSINTSSMSAHTNARRSPPAQFEPAQKTPDAQTQTTDMRFYNSQIAAEIAKRKNQSISKLVLGKQIESLYKPYWVGGDWVYYRNLSTVYPRPYILENVTNSYQECNQVCIKAYQLYGTVCGMKFDRPTAYYIYKTFENMCHLEFENCRSPSRQWHPIRRGPCAQKIKMIPQGSQFILDRLKNYEHNFTAGLEVLLQNPFYTPQPENLTEILNKTKSQKSTKS